MTLAVAIYDRTLVHRWLVIAFSALLLAVLIASALAIGPNGPATALDKPQLTEISGTPTFHDDKSLDTFVFVAKFRIATPRPDGRTLMWKTEVVTFELTQENGKSVVLGNSIVNLRDVGTDLVDLAEHVWREKHPPLPRQRVREPGTAK